MNKLDYRKIIIITLTITLVIIDYILLNLLTEILGSDIKSYLENKGIKISTLVFGFVLSLLVAIALCVVTIWKEKYPLTDSTTQENKIARLMALPIIFVGVFFILSIFAGGFLIVNYFQPSTEIVQNHTNANVANNQENASKLNTYANSTNTNANVVNTGVSKSNDLNTLFNSNENKGNSTTSSNGNEAENTRVVPEKINVSKPKSSPSPIEEIRPTPAKFEVNPEKYSEQEIADFLVGTWEGELNGNKTTLVFNPKIIAASNGKSASYNGTLAVWNVEETNIYAEKVLTVFFQKGKDAYIEVFLLKKMFPKTSG